MKRINYFPLIALVLVLFLPALVLAAKAPPTDNLGELYGDLYIILRDENGIPILADPVVDGAPACVQPTMVELVDGDLTLVVHPLINTVEDETYCELTDAVVVQEVDFGRLNLGRAPDPVLDHSFDEAVKAMNTATEIGFDPAGRLLLTIDGEYKTIDSPLENLALYVKLMRDGHWITEVTDPGGKGRGGSGGPPAGKGPPEGDGPTVEPRPVLSAGAFEHLTDIGLVGLDDTAHVINNNDLLLAASLLAAAADKSGSFTVDKIVYANAIYGIPGTLTGEDGKSYFDFSGFTYSKPFNGRGNPECDSGSVWVLQPTETANNWQATCMGMMSSINFVPVDFVVTDPDPNDEIPVYVGPGSWQDGVDNIAGFTQAANDALKAIEYIHNYRVPVLLEE